MDESKSIVDKSQIAQKLLLFYCVEGSLAHLRSILGRNPQLVNAADQHGLTPLFLAVKNKKYDVARYLESMGGDVERRNKSGQTALFWTAANNDLEGTACLLQLAANVNSLDNVRVPVEA
eukprot:TRINITY_DN7021_c0_g2_i2.p3 TRINITY_DN7021_c0_g2~~TRINITY_DN7021_c0_g2_i2.p3  ORF type:complete len:120 (+),score=18.11 TRINITY_DN7021_c0_g2_i2:8-367(+)